VEDAEGVLRRAPLFEGLDEDSARTIRRQMPDVKLSQGEHLFLEGQEGDRLYIAGRQDQTHEGGGRRPENLISVIGPGESSASYRCSTRGRARRRPARSPTRRRGAAP
jgi:CRP/FNR family transcriptional regulator